MPKARFGGAIYGLGQLVSSGQPEMKVGARLSVCAVVTSLASARNFTDLGPCGRAGRWGETVEEKLFFLKTIKTAGSTTRFAFMRFARGERMATLRANAPGGILFALDGSNQLLS